ncbi:transcription-repair coupling factor [Carboxydothermus pertinax]|uniref:Transcription-repair-coupling factor n=1 Tax=Carboxydothermus pertinax TaxID=870242 RepID=A0A1L8CV69_9THEO|nr:transcription-repair coupling factor [Carboxydothermus pertinax]GAV22791.1 transcription-repair coupling factor [Carboxydothermus pertinax]
MLSTSIFSLMQENSEFKRLLEGIKKKRPQLIYGSYGSARTFLLAMVAKALGRPLLVITENEQSAREMAEDLEFFLGQQTSRFFYREGLLFDLTVREKGELKASRIELLKKLSRGERPHTVVNYEALTRKYPPLDSFARWRREIAVGDSLDPDELALYLTKIGYERVDQVEAPGQFSRRGGIMDVYVPGEIPFRIEFFGDEIDSLRALDIESQRSKENLTNSYLFPAEIAVVDDDRLIEARRKIEKDLEEQVKKLIQQNKREAVGRLKEKGAEVFNILTKSEVIEKLLPYFWDGVSLLDYFEKDYLIFLDEPGRFGEQISSLEKLRRESFTEALTGGYTLPRQVDGFYSEDEIFTLLRQRLSGLTSLLPKTPRFVGDYDPHNFAGRKPPNYLGKEKLFYEDLRNFLQNGYRILVVRGREEAAVNLKNELIKRDFPVSLAADLETGIAPREVKILRGRLSSGFEFFQQKLLVYSDMELFGRTVKTREKQVLAEEKLEEQFTPGDFVVHPVHGIGKYLGIKPVEVGGNVKDYLVIAYQGEDRLYVPPEQVGNLQKYIGVDGEPPKLSRLGGGDWQKVKNRVKAAVREMAEGLLELYAKRMAKPGFAFSPDTVWQKEFEERFPYEETPDQLKAIAEVKRDMEKPKVMDRLLCGDVGYGKTEVALRAAFKAVMDGKQVAVLTPTTLLAQQHYNTFKERFSGYPVEIRLLSRFQTAREQKATLNELKKGKVDIIIGTHRLLQDDVRFYDLGLMIVDEEQRFGVAQKERLKLLTETVDVLTLTATPIPRTLHMALVGIRDLSILNTPPENRFPVQTYVLEEDPFIVRDAIRRELGRGGQVFFVHNRVYDIEEVAAWVQALVPEARVAVAHGQMKEEQLERVMLEFISGKYDVLVSTTIIETGIDLPNVNTLIIKNADRFGLAQLYQLRGRVGRSNRIAYAYLMYEKDKVLKESAEKRLAAIKEFTEFGSGLKLAMRDLEIRGAGNLLGPEQHGHIAAVGFDMYMKLLQEAVAELKGQATTEEVEPQLELNLTAYIPESYIPDEKQKIEMYRRLSRTRNLEDLRDVVDELIDRFGAIPREVENLIKLIKIKIMAAKLKVKGIYQTEGELKIQFFPNPEITAEKLARISGQLKGRVVFGMNPDLEVRCRIKGIIGDEIFSLLERILGQLS